MVFSGFGDGLFFALFAICWSGFLLYFQWALLFWALIYIWWSESFLWFCLGSLS